MIPNWGWFHGIVTDSVDARLGFESAVFMFSGAASRNHGIGSRGKSKDRTLNSGSLI